MKFYALFLAASMLTSAAAQAPSQPEFMHIGPFYLGMSKAEAESFGDISCENSGASIYCKPDRRLLANSDWASLRFDAKYKSLIEIRAGYIRPEERAASNRSSGIGELGTSSSKYLIGKSSAFKSEVANSLALSACQVGFQKHESDMDIETDICFASANQSRRISAGFNSKSMPGAVPNSQELYVWVSLRSDGGYARYIHEGTHSGNREVASR